ncbi:hypothetical protein POM88_010111 [Heracleum sosnowskyi]|uniref:Uncharacterized protein n=1 Tax=Heracleum sosnowskyi TaxID=360622 RepID=A0AAD8NA95_9APIA|nr:hypothetical protein POM88_010111 [Heracleum sosnowskyi]
MPMQEIVKPYGPWMKAMSRRQSYLTGSKWLRTGSSSQYTVGDGGRNRNVAGMEREGSRNLGTGSYDPKIKENVTVEKGRSAGNQEFTDMEEDWLVAVMDVYGTSKVIEIGMIMWSIWKARNMIVWHNTFTHVDEVVRSAHVTLDQWLDAQLKNFTPSMDVMLLGPKYRRRGG